MDTELYNEQPGALNINLDSRSFLSNTAKWGKFLAILGFIVVGLMVAGGLFSIAFLGAFSDGAGLSGFMGTGLLGVFYLVIALLYLLPVLYLYKFSTKMETGLRYNNEDVVTESFRNLKSLFKFMGILTIVMMALYVLLIIAMVAGFMGPLD